MDDDPSPLPNQQEGRFVPVGPHRVVPDPIPAGPDRDMAAPPPPPEAMRSGAGPIFWHVLFGLDLVVMGLSAIAGLAFYLWFASGQGTPTPVDGGSDTILWGNLVNLFMFGLVPLAWVVGTRVRPWRGTLRYLHLHSFWPSIGHGFGYAALLLGLVLFLFLGMDLFGWNLEETGTQTRFDGLTWPLVFMTAAVAGVAEEIFFRGILQKWIGVWGQAAVFGLFHIGGGLVPFLVTGAIGLLFGYLVKNGRSLWLVITAHFVYDLFLLAIAVTSGA